MRDIYTKNGTLGLKQNQSVQIVTYHISGIKDPHLFIILLMKGQSNLNSIIDAKAGQKGPSPGKLMHWGCFLQWMGGWTWHWEHVIDTNWIFSSYQQFKKHSTKVHPANYVKTQCLSSATSRLLLANTWKQIFNWLACSTSSHCQPTEPKLI